MKEWRSLRRVSANKQKALESRVGVGTGRGPGSSPRQDKE